MPADPDLPPEMLEYSARDFLSLAVETRMNLRMKAVAAFARRHSIDKLACPAPGRGRHRHGRQGAPGHHGSWRGWAWTPSPPTRRYASKPGSTWPLDAGRLLEFARGLSHILVIEEKGAVVESQIRTCCSTCPTAPPSSARKALTAKRWCPRPGSCAAAGAAAGSLAGPRGRPPPATWPVSSARRRCQRGRRQRRRPYFCSGCPHSTSTKVPEGSQAPAGVGCHYMAAWMDRDTGGLTQMGGEGVDWIGLSRYTKMPHVFQNMGEGTYYHSGYLAIRQAVAARANITYKILFNDAVGPADSRWTARSRCRRSASSCAARTWPASSSPPTNPRNTRAWTWAASACTTAASWTRCSANCARFPASPC